MQCRTRPTEDLNIMEDTPTSCGLFHPNDVDKRSENKKASLKQQRGFLVFLSQLLY